MMMTVMTVMTMMTVKTMMTMVTMMTIIRVGVEARVRGESVELPTNCSCFDKTIYFYVGV